ncbi:MAG TPA: acetate kinase [Gammaproteobacteria bacterium]|nr:acetate kinase [Gammaproteobacteria bacterium]
MSAAKEQVLVVNSGSSSVKFSLFDLAASQCLLTGRAERIGEAEGRLILQGDGGKTDHPLTLPDHRAAFAAMVEALREAGVHAGPGPLAAVGHRVVHGGERFDRAVLIDDEVLAAIGDLAPLAPLHNPANCLGINIARQVFPEVPQVAVFDTAFHQTMPAYAARYALPGDCYTEHGVRRYGFHGSSHAYVARQAAALLERSATALNLITLHLGNGCSAAAIRGGRCIDTSMGMTPLEGLVMGTRCGDLDPAVPLLLARKLDRSPAEVDRLLNEESGLKGLSGVADMRDVLARAEAGEETAGLALTLFCYRAKKYLGAYYAALGRVDAVVFTAGIGEHAAVVRETICTDLEPLGIIIDHAKNNRPATGSFDFHRADAKVKLLVIPTNEEMEIAWQTCQLIRGVQSS